METDVFVYLGIFDDGDVIPTTCVMQVTGDMADPLNQAQFVVALLELREVCEKEYGRAAPDHALFWSAAPA